LRKTNFGTKIAYNMSMVFLDDSEELMERQVKDCPYVFRMKSRSWTAAFTLLTMKTRPPCGTKYASHQRNGIATEIVV